MMPAPKTTFIQHSCFGYYDEGFEECTNKCCYAKECRKATSSEECEEIRRVFKYKKSQIREIAEKYAD